MSQIFVDTWAWYALVDAGDADHKAAQQTNERLLDKGHTMTRLFPIPTVPRLP